MKLKTRSLFFLTELNTRSTNNNMHIFFSFVFLKGGTLFGSYLRQKKKIERSNLLLLNYILRRIYNY